MNAMVIFLAAAFWLGVDAQSAAPCTTGGSVPEGSTCVFPFTYNGVQYYQCTTADNGNTPWCSLDSTYSSRWGNCVCDCAPPPPPPPPGDDTDTWSDARWGCAIVAVITCCVAAGALACADGDDDIKALGAGCGCCCVIALVVMFFFTANEVASLTDECSCSAGEGWCTSTSACVADSSGCGEDLIFCSPTSSSDSELDGMPSPAPSDSGTVQDMSECESSGNTFQQQPQQQQPPPFLL